MSFGINSGLVDSTSSRIGVLVENVDTLVVDHVGMARFKIAEDPRYGKVVATLKGAVTATVTREQAALTTS